MMQGNFAIPSPYSGPGDNRGELRVDLTAYLLDMQEKAICPYACRWPEDSESDNPELREARLLCSPISRIAHQAMDCPYSSNIGQRYGCAQRNKDMTLTGMR